MDTINIGILSTASVNAYSILPYKGNIRGMKVAAVASRDYRKASEYVRKHSIPTAFGDYESLLADPAISCVYIPLPVSMHREWSIRAMRAGKHVLCEKPVAANAAEAQEIRAVADETGMIFAEAFHYRYHPLAAKIEEIVRGGDLGEIVRITSQFGVPLLDRGKIQFRPDCAGGALLDIGCYPASFSRWIAACDDYTVDKARFKMISGVDGAVAASVSFSTGTAAKITGSLVEYLPMFAHVQGSRGSLFVFMPFTPAIMAGPFHIDSYLCLLRRGPSVKNIRVAQKVSYHAQLEAFRDAIIAHRQPVTNAPEAVANMRLLDAIAALR